MSNVDYTLNDRRTEKLYLRVAEKAMEDVLEGTEFGSGDCTHHHPEKEFKKVYPEVVDGKVVLHDKPKPEET